MIPSFVMTDGAPAERAAIHATFDQDGAEPNRSCRHILCYFHVARALLTSIWGIKPKAGVQPLPPEIRRQVYAGVMFMVRLPHLVRVQQAYDALEELCKQYKPLMNWFETTFKTQYRGLDHERIAEWCLGERDRHWPTTNNMVEGTNLAEARTDRDGAWHWLFPQENQANLYVVCLLYVICLVVCANIDFDRLKHCYPFWFSPFSMARFP